jgi:hypothetical protein
MEAMRLTRERVKVIQDQIKAAVAGVCEQHQIKVARCSARYDDLHMAVRLELECLGEAGDSEADRQSFRLFASMVGLTSEDYGKVIDCARRKYRLVRIEPSRPVYPIVGEDVATGKRYRLTEDSVKLALEAMGRPKA